MVDKRYHVPYTMPISRQSLRCFFFCFISHQMIDIWRRCSAIHTIRIIPSTIPRMEQKILCAAFLEAALRFYEDPANQAAFEKWRTGKD